MRAVDERFDDSLRNTKPIPQPQLLYDEGYQKAVTELIHQGSQEDIKHLMILYLSSQHKEIKYKRVPKDEET